MKSALVMAEFSLNLHQSCMIDALMKIADLNGAAKERRMNCFADDYPLLCNDKAETNKLIRVMVKIKELKLSLKKLKTKIARDSRYEKTPNIGGRTS